MTTIETEGLMIDARWVGHLPATAYEPEEPGDFYVDSIVVADPMAARELFETLGVRLPEEGDVLTNSGSQARVYAWAYDSDWIRNEAR